MTEKPNLLVDLAFALDEASRPEDACARCWYTYDNYRAAGGTEDDPPRRLLHDEGCTVREWIEKVEKLTGEVLR